MCHQSEVLQQLNKQLVIVDKLAYTPAGPVCSHCGRICASDFGLRSHLRVHLWPYDRQLHQCNVIVENDGLLIQAGKHYGFCTEASLFLDKPHVCRSIAITGLSCIEMTNRKPYRIRSSIMLHDYKSLWTTFKGHFIYLSSAVDNIMIITACISPVKLRCSYRDRAYCLSAIAGLPCLVLLGCRSSTPFFSPDLTYHRVSIIIS